MEQVKQSCPNCGKTIPNQVLYKCVRCFTEYCAACDDSRNGRACPKCGMGPRIVLDQGNSNKGGFR